MILANMQKPAQIALQMVTAELTQMLVVILVVIVLTIQVFAGLVMHAIHSELRAQNLIAIGTGGMTLMNLVVIVLRVAAALAG